MKAVVLQVLVLLSLTGVATVATWKFHPGAPALYLNAEPLDDGEVSVEIALKWQAVSGVIWIDARLEEKYVEDHVPGAILLNEFNFKSLLMNSFHLIANQEQPIVVYCGSYSCKASTKVAEELRAMMIPDVYVLKGGWDAWTEVREE